MGFILGLGAGYGLGMLFAPKRGEEIRSDLTERANEFVDTAKKSFAEAKDRVQRGGKGVRSAGEPATGTKG